MLGREGERGQARQLSRLQLSITRPSPQLPDPHPHLKLIHESCNSSFDILIIKLTMLPSFVLLSSIWMLFCVLYDGFHENKPYNIFSR